MGERKGQNKYYPPDFDPAKHGNLNRYHGTHALRERANKIHLGILRIRFEMPYNIWCLGCRNHVAMGVRYNADKKKVGMYYSTPVYEFRMKCHLCDNYFVIRTDPENFDYTPMEGCERQERRWDTESYGDSGHDRAHTAKLESDAMYKLEHKKDDQDKKDALKPVMADLERFQERLIDDYGANSYMRKIFRTEKKDIRDKAASDEEFLRRTQLLGAAGVAAAPESDDDRRHARLIAMKMGPDSAERRAALRRELIDQSIFDSSAASSSSQSLLSTSAGHEKPADNLRKRLLLSKPAQPTSVGPGAAKKLRAGPVLVVRRRSTADDQLAEAPQAHVKAESISDPPGDVCKTDVSDADGAAAVKSETDVKSEPTCLPNDSLGSSLVADYGSSSSDND